MTDPTRRDAPRRFVEPLPYRPSLEHQRKRARALMRAYCAGDGAAAERVQALHPRPPAADAFKLSDAQLVVARGYGVPSWPKLKARIDRLTRSAADRFVDAVKAGDTAGVRQLLADHPDLSGRINAPLFDFGRRAVHAARGNPDLLDLLLAHGADINAKSDWHKGGFGILEDATPDQAEALLARGAVLDVWAAANLGRIDDLRRLVDADPALVDARGGDGKRPLHYARTVDIARLLLDRGSDIDARDNDHDSTPAQHLVGDRPEVSRYLLSRGAQSDLLLAAVLGDADRVRAHLDDDPACIRMRVSQDWLPMIDTAENGGHIYQWTLGFYLSAGQIAEKFGHPAVAALLHERTAPVDRLMEALWAGDGPAADRLLATHPDLLTSADELVWRQVADAARGNRCDVVTAMLALGFPVTATSQHGATPLHWAAFHGNPAMLDAVLSHRPPLDARDRDFGGKAVDWAMHGAGGQWPGISTGRQADCIDMLLNAGAPWDETDFPTGHDAIDTVLRRHLFGR